MKKLLFMILVLLFPLKIDASSASYVVMDADSGRVLESYNENTKMLIASTTKIMTAIVAIENGILNEEYLVGPEIKKVYGSMIYIKEGEILTLEDLLYGLMLRSGNDAAMVIATNTIGYEKFIKLMNDKAYSLGMNNTVFTNPHGLDDVSQNYSTAYDMTLLMRYAMQNETFRNITRTKKYKCQTNLNVHIWYNKNDLLINYKYATGGKIGFTTKSRHVFVSSASKDDKNLVIASIKDTDRFNTHKYLYEKIFEKYERYQILNQYTFFVNENLYKKYHLYIKNDFYMLLKDNEKKKLELKINLIKNKIIIGEERIGYVNILLNNKVIHTETIYAIKEQSKIHKIKSLLFFWKK